MSNRRNCARLAGLAAVARQSGQWKGKSFIRGGRANVRQDLYMPALVAARFNPDLKAKYQQLTTAGETSKGRVTAVIRKLVITANALLKADRLWIKNSPLIITDSLGGELAVLQAPMLDGLLDPFTLDDGSPPPPK